MAVGDVVVGEYGLDGLDEVVVAVGGLLGEVHEASPLNRFHRLAFRRVETIANGAIRCTSLFVQAT